jgi:hypothetical protein
MVTRLGLGVIDKLDLRIPNGSVLRPAVRDYTRGLPYETYTARVRPAVHYTGKADLRSVGMDAILHVQCKHGDNHHKLEVLDAGNKSYSEIVDLVESVTGANPERMGVMRIDLTADVKGVTVPWLKSHVRFKFKRTENEHGQIRYGLIGRGEVETILAGSRPNVFRIYNKTKESIFQFRRMQRKASKETEPLEFEKEFGFKETDIRTRIERQCGGNRIPSELASFGSLQNAPMFNPFTSLEILTSGRVGIPSPDECDGLEYYTGLGLHEESQRLGMQAFRKQLNKQSKGNAARTMDSYRRFFPDGAESPITLEQIYEAYRSSTNAQLAA